MKRVGDIPELGDILGYGQDADKRYARLVGIRKDNCRAMERFIFRLFQRGDKEFPTGEYKTSWLIVPWSGREL